MRVVSDGGNGWAVTKANWLDDDGVETGVVLCAPPLAFAMSVDVARLVAATLMEAADRIEGVPPSARRRRRVWNSPGFWAGWVAAAAFVSLLIFLVEVAL